jgi:hypothetical protein
MKSYPIFWDFFSKKQIFITEKVFLYLCRSARGISTSRSWLARLCALEWYSIEDFPEKDKKLLINQRNLSNQKLCRLTWNSKISIRTSQSDELFEWTPSYFFCQIKAFFWRL